MIRSAAEADRMRIAKCMSTAAVLVDSMEFALGCRLYGGDDHAKNVLMLLTSRYRVRKLACSLRNVAKLNYH